MMVARGQSYTRSERGSWLGHRASRARTVEDRNLETRKPEIETLEPSNIHTVDQAERRLWIGDRSAVEVPCSIEMERSGETLHAHVSLDGIEVDCGDEVLIHAAPTHLDFGDRLTTTSRATIVKAGPFRRWLTRIQSYFALTELYEVGFQPKHEIKFTSSEIPPRASEARESVASQRDARSVP